MHTYLVHYRALAAAMYDYFLGELEHERLQEPAGLATDDHTDPILPEETNILVPTYEN